MWKRLNNQRGARQSAIGMPVSRDPRLDENRYGGGLGTKVDRVHRGQPPPRPPRDDLPEGLPYLPFKAGSPPESDHRESTFRPASSIYSQSAPIPDTPQFPINDTTYADGVSPPSSPDIGTLNNSYGPINDDEVSPIDETPDISRLGIARPDSKLNHKQPVSSIPVLRREKKRGQVGHGAASVVTRKEVGGRASKDIRWDPFSGEITSSQRGKPQSVKPGDFTPPDLRNVEGPMGTTSGIETSTLAKTQKSFGERVRNLKISTSTERPEWKGASGRAAMVSPVADQMDVAPLNIPRKSSRRVTSPVYGSPSPVSVIQYGDATSPTPAIEYSEPTTRMKASNSGHDMPQLLNTSVNALPGADLEVNSSDVETSQANRHRKQDSLGTIERNFRQAFKEVGFSQHSPDDPHTYIEPPSRFSVTTYAPSEAPYVQPPSRFSVTTYAASEAPYVPPSSRFSVTTYAPSEAQNSPRPSTDTFDHPPMPSPPQNFTTSQQPSPIVDRKRPKVVESPKSTTRKAVPSSPVLISMTSSVTSKRASNLLKSLPPSPAEASSQDLISVLQAQLDDLALRRNNITKSIRQMTELMPRDGVLVTDEVRRRREAEKVKVEGLREEEADVRRQEHEIGLRLHRAYKRKDKNAEFEPTGLWVRRVTG